MEPAIIVMLGGVLPFGSIFIEMCVHNSSSILLNTYKYKTHADVTLASSVVYCVCIQVFHCHIILGLQNLLCVWLHVACVGHTDSGDDVCHNCVHLLPTQC
jgi:hypothetical protein